MDVTPFEVNHDGRLIEGERAGPETGGALVFHNGTPTAALLSRPMVDAATAQGLQIITMSRPGYAGSTAQRGRSVADAAADTAAVLDSFDVREFVTLGWSGGGPHGLACVALLPERCLAAASLAGVAPYDADIDWLAGMGDENIEEFSLAAKGEDALLPFLEAFAAGLAGATGADIAESLGDLVSEVDLAALTGDFADHMAATLRKAVSTGVAGWRDDDLAFVRPWGFDPSSITRPVAVWQGREDRMVPFAHGEWLASTIPSARAHLLAAEGHLSLAVDKFGDIVADLAGLAGWGGAAA